MRVRGIGFVLMAALFVPAAGAVAQVEEPGRRHFLAGSAYYEAGEYDDAAREFQRSYDLSHRPELLFNLHLCYQALGDLQRAADHLEGYLRGVEDLPNRANLEMRLENLRRRSAEQRAPRPAPAPVDEGGGAPVAAIVSFAAAGVGLAATATFGALALGERSSVAESDCGMTRTCSDDEVGDMDTLALLSDIGLGMAVVGAALGVVFLVSDDGGSNERAGGVRAGAIAMPGVAAVSIAGRL